MSSFVANETYTLRTPELSPVKTEEESADVECSLDPSQALKFIDDQATATPLDASEAKKRKEKADEESDESDAEKGKKKPKKPSKVKPTQARTRRTATLNANSKKTSKANATMHVTKDILGDIGNVAALPAEIDGKEVNYLPLNTGLVFRNKAQKMSEMPLDTCVVIENWRKITSQYGDSFVMDVRGDADLSYWSNSRATAILLGGFVDPKTQYFTISRLSDGSFVYGTLDRI